MTCPRTQCNAVPDQACVSQKTRKLLGPEDFSGLFSGEFFGSWDPFLERPGNLTGPKSYFEIKFSRKVECVLTSNEVHFVSLADNFTVQFSNLLKLLSRMKNKTA